MKTLAFIFLVLCETLLAITPHLVLDSKSEVVALKLLETNVGDKLYVSTINGEVDIYDINALIAKKTIKPTRSIVIPSYKDLFDNVVKRRIFYTDVNAKQEALIVALNANATRDLFLYKNGKSEIIISDLDVAKALWIDERNFAVGFVGNEVWIVDSVTKQVRAKRKNTIYRLSDMVLSPTDNVIYTSGESGVIYALDSKNGDLLSKFDGVHKDSILSLALAKNVLVSGGMDKRLAIYELQSQGKVAKLKDTIRTDFLIYSVALSADSKLIAYMSDESGNISVLMGKSEVATLKNIQAVPNSIIFYKHYVLVGTDSNKVYIFDIKNALQ